MKICRLFLAIPLLSVSVWASPAADELVLPEKLFPHLDGILKNAVQRSPRMLNRVLDLEIAENSRIQARAGLLPSAGGYVSLRKSWDQRTDTDGRELFTKTYYDFSITQPLFHWGERRNSAKMGEIQAAIAKGNYRESYRLFCQELRGSYLGLIAQKLGLKRAEFFLQYTNSNLAQAEDRLAKKVISEAEMFPIRMGAEQAQISAERARFEFANAKASYARLAGIPEITDDMIAETIPAASYIPSAVDELLAGYLSQKEQPTIEAVNMRRQMEIQKLTYKNAKTALRPKVSFVAGTSQDEQSFTVDIENKYKVNAIYAGLSINWAIFDGFNSRSAARTALARQRQTENEYRNLTEQLTAQAQAQAKLINFSARNMSISDRYLDSFEANLRIRSEEFRRGVRSEMEVSQAQLSLFDAQIGALNSRAEFLMKTGDFLGTITEDPAIANVSEK